MRTWIVGVALVVVLAVSAGFAAPVPGGQGEFEDRPIIVVSSGSVILNVDRGSWVREAAGRYRQEVARGRDVIGFSASTGSGATACTVTGDSLILTYGVSAISFVRQESTGQPGQRRATLVRLQTDATVSTKGGQTLVIQTTEGLVSISNGGARPEDTCRVAGGRLEIQQRH